MIGSNREAVTRTFSELQEPERFGFSPHLPEETSQT